jgi:hypothetical protein
MITSSSRRTPFRRILTVAAASILGLLLAGCGPAEEDLFFVGGEEAIEEELARAELKDGERELGCHHDPRAEPGGATYGDLAWGYISPLTVFGSFFRDYNNHDDLFELVPDRSGEITLILSGGSRWDDEFGTDLRVYEKMSEKRVAYAWDRRGDYDELTFTAEAGVRYLVRVAPYTLRYKDCDTDYDYFEDRWVEDCDNVDISAWYRLHVKCQTCKPGTYRQCYVPDTSLPEGCGWQWCLDNGQWSKECETAPEEKYGSCYRPEYAP